MALPCNSLPFPELRVGPCHVQTAADRFGRRAVNILRRRDAAWAAHDPLHFDEDGLELDDAAELALVPKLQRWALNLTALSQHYNLYFAAYEDHIAVYCPRTVPGQRLPSKPDLVVVPPRSAAAQLLPGPQSQSRVTGHQANHILVGQLGSEEVLVVAFDDGDVTAWFTSEIADQVRYKAAAAAATGSNPIPNPICLKPFFTANVGASAWGLAVHSRSRLIAASCNRHHVVIFALALQPDGKTPVGQKPLIDPMVLPIIPGSSRLRISPAEVLVRSRTRSWTIIVGLGKWAENLPCIDFLNDRQGLAEKICAIDVSGQAWVADIWRADSPVLAICRFRAWRSSGWSVLPLLKSAFLIVNRCDQLTASPVLPSTQPPSCYHHENIAANIFSDCLRDPMSPLKPPCQPSDSDDADSDSDAESSGSDYSNSPDQGDEDAYCQSGQSQNQNLPPVAIPHYPKPKPPSLQAQAQQTVEAPVQLPVYQPGPPPGASLFSSLQGASFLSFLNNPEYSSVLIMNALASATAQDNGQANTAFEDDGGNIDWSDQSSASSDPETESGPGSSLVRRALGWETINFNDIFYETVGVAWKGGHNRFSLRTSVQYAERQFIGSDGLEMVYTPHNGMISRKLGAMDGPGTEIWGWKVVVNSHVYRWHDCKKSLDRQPGHRDLLRRYHLLQGFRRNMVLCKLDYRPGGPMTISDFPLRHFPSGLLMRDTDRVHMVAHVPALWLVIVASQQGRVQLITPTRLRRGATCCSAAMLPRRRHAFRIDHLLPSRADEIAGRFPPHQLFSIAVGPVQEAAAGSLLLRTEGGSGVGAREARTRPAISRTYRLLLHFRDHSILSYELSRSTGGALCIV